MCVWVQWRVEHRVQLDGREAEKQGDRDTTRKKEDGADRSDRGGDTEGTCHTHVKHMQPFGEKKCVRDCNTDFMRVCKIQAVTNGTV